ncbi:unnamed protein product [Closterium sp. NIES-64]|nr:unnamed protein product [Closterium sp. NIES-64]
MDGPARSVALAEGEQLAAITVDPFMGSVPAIHVKRIKEGSREQHSPPGSNNALRAMRCVSCAACHALRAMRCVPCAACHVLRAMCCVPCTARHALRAMRCMPCAACHVLWWASQFPAPCARSSVSRLSPLLLPSEEEESVLQVTAPQGQIMRLRVSLLDKCCFCFPPCPCSFHFHHQRRRSRCCRARVPRAESFVCVPDPPSYLTLFPPLTLFFSPSEEDESVLQITGPQGRIMRCVWGPLNQTLIGTGEDCIIRMWDAEVPTQQNTHRHGGEEDCIIRMWDAETGKLLRETEPEVAHSKTVTSLSKSADGSHFITGSLDKCAKVRLHACARKTVGHTHTASAQTYQTERPINAADISPLFDHFPSLLHNDHHLSSSLYLSDILWEEVTMLHVSPTGGAGGGQDAASVTTTSSRAGKFEAVFYHKVLEEEIGRVKGHFGPLNALAFGPDGRRIISKRMALQEQSHLFVGVSASLVLVFGMSIIDDADDFEPPPVVVAKEPVKSSWEDEEEEEEAPAPTTTASAKPKGEKKKKKAEDKGKGKEKEEEEEVDDGVLADPVAEKLRQQRLVEESDFKATKELFGGKKKEAERSLDDFLPKSEADFNEFADLIAARITPHSKSFHYVSLIKNILRKVEAPLVGKDAKEISAAAAVIANEKLKAEKEAEKGKKKGAKKQQLTVDRPEDDDYKGSYAGPDDDYDFM